mmetsp:Transcript_5974/g.5131  ORF Transcript_5974/g.5131 Transcript_5974/m.5131 type:complete len:167 (-) Transcript_5974:25-525(-)
MKLEEKKKQEEQFLENVYDTLKEIMTKRPAQPVYEYANILLQKVGKAKPEYLSKIENRKESERKRSKSSSSSSSDSSLDEIHDATVDDYYKNEINILQKKKILENDFGTFDISDSSSSSSSDDSDKSEDEKEDKKRKKAKKARKEHKESKEAKKEEAMNPIEETKE